MPDDRISMSWRRETFIYFGPLMDFGLIHFFSSIFYSNEQEKKNHIDAAEPGLEPNTISAAGQ